jgi:hypothetical protein
VRLRKGLKLKIKPAIEDPASVPMSIYFNLIAYDTQMFKSFVSLSHGMRKHLLFYVFEIMAPTLDHFMRKFGSVFTI